MQPQYGKSCLRARGAWLAPSRLQYFPIWSLKVRRWCTESSPARRASGLSTREATTDGRARLSNLWVPTGGVAESDEEDSHSKLMRAGFLRQAHSGIFHMLPLGRRVQDKLEALIDKHMYQLGASKVSLSSISSEELWSRSGRLQKGGSELFRFQDRKEGRYLLSPTHEEEITSLVSSTVKSYKELPLRLFQISRKYRDEKRPRHGLLRGREFIMKDLYTFDYSSKLALATYHQVREGYARLFDELKLPYMVAEADSGDIGGDLSHEFHFPTPKGEDNIISCTTCDYVANEELAESPTSTKISQTATISDLNQVSVWRAISLDKRTLINVWYLSPPALAEASQMINIYAVKLIFSELDASIEDPVAFWQSQASSTTNNSQHLSLAVGPQRIVNLVDDRVPKAIKEKFESKESGLPFWPSSLGECPADVVMETRNQNPSTKQPLNLLRITNGDPCPRCSDGTLEVQKAIELGHTFHLGTRYSEPLQATVAVPAEVIEREGMETYGSKSGQQVPMQMGCHGIGVSRIIGAVADTLADDKGLNWPRVMAPFEAVVIPGGKGNVEAAQEVYDVLSNESSPTGDGLDLVLDDRTTQSFAWKMKDADLVGYPVIVVVGRKWASEELCEVQCRRLNVRQDVPIAELPDFLRNLLER